MTRLALVVAVATAGVTAAVTGHHYKRPVSASSATPAPVLDIPHVSRAVTRLPLRPQPSPSGGVPRRSSPRPVTRPAGAAAAQFLADVTMYCATGNRNATGRWPRLGDVAVIDHSIPFGSRVHIAGNVYTVADWIGSGSQFDIFGGDDAGCESRALTFGRRHLSVVVTR